MEKELHNLCVFPSKEITAQTLPLSFRNFPNIRCIIDCTEVFIDRASSLSVQAQTFSNYKHHNTVKFLVAITPTGGICYVSNAWGGRTSDRVLTERCGFLDYIEEGDVVMADKGFTIGDLLTKKKAFLNIPPFLRSKQFSVDEIAETKAIATVRIHVERAIGRVKHFHILDANVPLALSRNIEKIFHVCCFLTNLDKPLVM
jgi:DDE superfamily endonuclease